MALYLFTSEGSSRRTFGVNLAVGAQKHGSESIITHSIHYTMLNHPGAFTSSIGARWDYISGVAGVQGLAALHQSYKDAGLEFGGKTSDKARRNRPTRGPWTWKMPHAPDSLVDQSAYW
jgi:hypothetical protein